MSVSAGSPIQISASDWNTLLEVADWYRIFGPPKSASPPPDRFDTGTIRVKNASESAVGIGEILGIDRPIFDRVTSADEFKFRVSLSCVEPTPDHAGKFVVITDPLEPTEIGRYGVVSGVTVAKVTMADETHTSADVDPDSGGTILLSQDGGIAQLLWVEPAEDRETPDVAWCVIRIGGGSVVMIDPCADLGTP